MGRAAAVVAGLVVALVAAGGQATARPIDHADQPKVAVHCPKPQPLQVWKVPVHQAMLTFDDGPSPVYTPIALAILARYHVHATFFLVGKNAAAYPDLVRRIVAGGNVIGNHSWDHAN